MPTHSGLSEDLLLLHLASYLGGGGGHSFQDLTPAFVTGWTWHTWMVAGLGFPWLHWADLTVTINSNDSGHDTSCNPWSIFGLYPFDGFSKMSLGTRCIFFFFFYKRLKINLSYKKKWILHFFETGKLWKTSLGCLRFVICLHGTWSSALPSLTPTICVWFAGFHKHTIYELSI